MSGAIQILALQAFMVCTGPILPFLHLINQNILHKMEGGLQKITATVLSIAFKPTHQTYKTKNTVQTMPYIHTNPY